MPTQTFTTGDDTFSVPAGPGTYDLDFLAGNDTLTVNGGDATTARMGDGNDIIRLLAGPATVYGDLGADTFAIFASNVIANGGGDNDIFNLRAGSGQTLNGDDGNDLFTFLADFASITLNGGNGDDEFQGGNRVISGSIYGGAGNDFFSSFNGSGTLSLYGGAGNDIYRVDAVSPATFVEVANEGTDLAQVPRGISYTLPNNIENLTVGDYAGANANAATLTGNIWGNVITGSGNDETLYGLAGNDVMNGLGGNDTLYGDIGADTLNGATGNDFLYGGGGDDVINGGVGIDTMAGGAGNDAYFVDSLSDVVTENPGEGTDVVRVTVSNYVLPDNVENGILYSAIGLRLDGNALNNSLTGSGGNEQLYGWDGDDTLFGAANNDVLHGGNGNDTLLGGNGIDTLYGEADSDMLNGGLGADKMYGGTGDDTYVVDNVGDLVSENAGEGTDLVQSSITYTLTADVENLTLTGSAALDGTGNGLDNVITGNAGANVLNGGAGNDTFYSGGGVDTLTGGSGNDTFNFTSLSDSLPGAADTITDFTSNAGEGSDDQIDLSAIDANTSLAGDQAFTFNGSFTAAAHSLWLAATPNGDGSVDWILYGDVNGDTTADFELHFHTPTNTLNFDDITP